MTIISTNVARFYLYKQAPEAVNVVFCDCPGITEDEENSFQTTLDNVETAHGIILLTDAFKSNAGIEQNKVSELRSIRLYYGVHVNNKKLTHCDER